MASDFLLYVEAVMGTNDATSDPTAMKYFNMVRQRAGLTEPSSVTYLELLKERRCELAFESQTWFDTQRLRYRSGNDAALNWVNNGHGTGYNRCTMYLANAGVDATNENNEDSYKLVSSKAEYGMYDPILLTASSFVCPIPAAVSSSSPSLSGAPVDYYGGAAEPEPAE